MVDELLARKVEWPRPRRRGPVWWFASFGAAASIVFLFLPKITELPLWSRLLLTAVLAMVPPLVEFACKLLVVIGRRARDYDKVRSVGHQAVQALSQEKARSTSLDQRLQDTVAEWEVRVEQLETQRREIVERAAEEVGEERARIDFFLELLAIDGELFGRLGVKVVGVRRIGDEPHLILDGRSTNLRPGIGISVADLPARKVRGRFEVTAQTPDGYLARRVGTPDPMWWGYIHQQSQLSSAPPTGIVAITLPKWEGINA